MKKIFLILIGLILLGCSSADKTPNNNYSGYYPWYNDYYYGYYDSYYGYDNDWDDLSDEEKKETIQDLKNDPEFQEYVKDKVDQKFPDGIPNVQNPKAVKENLMENKDQFNGDRMQNFDGSRMPQIKNFRGR